MYLLFVESVVIGYGSIDCVAIIFCLAKSHVPRKKKRDICFCMSNFLSRKKKRTLQRTLIYVMTYHTIIANLK